MLAKLKFIIVGVLILGTYTSYRLYRHFYPKILFPLPAREEVALTIIPGWNLRQVAEYLVSKGFASSTTEVYDQTGKPATFTSSGLNEPHGSQHISPEGYLKPETLRVYRDALLADVIEKFIVLRKEELKSFGYEGGPFQPIADQPGKNWHQIITMASIIEKETKHNEDRALVADILWRRVKRNWALQVDSSVHYAVDRTGDVFTTAKERQVDSPWNTYKYSGLPPGPICNPGLESINAALNPEPNGYWYFLSGRDGRMHYAKTLEEHNRNKKYL